MNNNDVKKGLKQCSSVDKNKDCGDCPYGKRIKDETCITVMCGDAFAYVEYLEAENERLKTEKDNLIKTYRECQVANLKEFVDKLENEIDCQPCSKSMVASAERYKIKRFIHKVLKEMVNENE